MQHLQGLLELRLEAVQGANSELMKRVRKVIDHLQPDAGDVAQFMRSVVQCALDLIAARELPPDRRFPKEWLTEWRYERADIGERWPTELGRALSAIRLMAGAQPGIPPVARYVTRGTYLLLDHLHEVGNFGQHPAERDRIDPSCAVAWCWSCIAMVESLARDLAPRG
jgi:hypothetical protein